MLYYWYRLHSYLVFLILSLFLWGGGLWSQEFSELEIRELKDVLQTIKVKNQGISNFQANFKEYSSQYGLRQGKIYIKRPNLMKLQYFYGEDINMEVYINTEKLYVYSINKKLVYEQSLKKNLTEDNLIETIEEEVNNYLLNFDYLEENYDFNLGSSNLLVSLFDESALKRFNQVGGVNPLTYYFELTPKNVTRQLDYLNLWVSKKGALLRSSSQSVENRVRDVYFFNISVKEVSEQVFNFIIPANVRLINNILPKLEF